MRRVSFFLVAIASILFASCEVEFSPNAEWKDIPVVYCLLDDGDDTSFVRVQRCYLTEGSIYTPAAISDSINYKEGTINVLLVVHRNNGSTDTLPFEYMERNHNEGDFASQNQPLYYYPTKGKFKNVSHYELIIEKNADNSRLATATTLPVLLPFDTAGINNKKIIRNIGENHNRTDFGFYDYGGTRDNTCHIEWYNLVNARLYQPSVRFYYSEYGDTMSVDLSCGRVLNTIANAETQSVNYSRNTFLADLKYALQGDDNPKKYLKKVDVIITACNEDINAYLNSMQSNSNLSESHQTYSNIDGGIGVFAARSTHIMRRFPSDTSFRSGIGLYDLLTNLGINMN